MLFWEPRSVETALSSSYHVRLRGLPKSCSLNSTAGDEDPFPFSDCIWVLRRLVERIPIRGDSLFLSGLRSPAFTCGSNPGDNSQQPILTLDSANLDICNLASPRLTAACPQAPVAPQLDPGSALSLLDFA